jgi:FKBP-type peptidyl-prolyl cis-trans isomerase 2
MTKAKHGDTVRVHYTGKLEDGTVFDSSRQRDPLQVTLGSGQVISGFERALEGMSPGDSKSVAVPPAEGYGDRQDDRIIQYDRSRLPAGAAPEVGQQVQLQSQDGSQIPAVVTRVSESSITLDANHPLAGRDLTFELELVEIA